MKRRKKNLLRKTMAVLLSAILFIGGLPGNVADTSMAAEWETVSGNGGMVSPGEPDTVSGNSSVELPAGPGELDTVSGNDSLTMSRPVIIGWKFPDGAVSPQGDLFYEDGIYSLLLPGGDSEIQIPMEDIVGLLPESVTVEWSCQNFAPMDEQETGASAGNNMETGEKELVVAGWNCPEYTEDGEGILPCSGSFFFQAQLCGEEEYALGEDVAQIGVQVVFDEPMLLAVTAQPGRITSDQEWGAQTLQAGTYTIDPGVTVTVTGRLTVSGTVTINGGGTLARGYAGTTSSNGSNHCLLYVKGGTLTLENICVDGKEMTACGPAIYIESGTVNLERGSVVQNNKNMNTGSTAGTYAGGGIYCDGTLNINGGSIRNNRTEATVGSLLYTQSGGAVYLKGICNMTSGSITGNTAANGGGIYLASTGATLNLSGGTIKDNHANGNGDGIFYSTYNNTTSSLRIGGNTNVADVIYLDNTKGSLCPSITSELKYPIRLACSSREEGKVLAMGSSYTLTGVDASKVSMAGTDLFSKLDKANNAIILSTTEELEATWQEVSGGEWKKGKFTTALEKVYDGGTIKLLTDILLTQKAEITKQITITSDNPSAPCTMTRMPEGDWGNITLTGNGAGLRLTNIIYDGNRAFLSGNENAIQQSLIKVGSASDTAPTLTLGSGCVIRNGYKTDGSGVIAVYGTLIAENGSVIEDCEVTGTGGAIWISSAGKATLRGITVQNCRAGSGGSALSIDGTCTLESGVFKDNQDSSAKNCVIYLRNSGTGNLTITGSAQISGGTNSIYNEGKTVKISGKEKLSGNIYTTVALEGHGSGVDANLNGNPHRIYWGGTLANGTVVVRGCTNSTACTLVNDGYALSAESGNLVMRQAWQITYVKNSGSIAEEANYTGYVEGKGLTLPIPTRAGYSFGGWYTDSACTTGKKAAVSGSETGDKTFYAKWIQNHRCSAAGTQTEYEVLPTMTGGTLQAGSYFLDRDVDLTTAITVSGTVNLCLNGHQIRQTGAGERIFTIGNGARLNLCDCNGSRGSHTVTSPVTGKSVTVSGGLLTGGRSNGLGGAVWVDNGGTFYLYGGTLAANTSSGSGGHGGAVRADGTFHMYGGEISHNKTGCGGGICICNGETKIFGGRIAYNESTDDGGGVFFESSGNRFSMSGGEIVSNRAVSCGGGIHCFTGVMEVSGSAVVKDNYIVKDGVQITDNVYLDAGRELSAGQLGSGALIGVSTQSAPGQSPVPVAGAGSGKYTGYFFSDNTQYYIVNQDNTVKLARDTQAPTGVITVAANQWKTFLSNITFGLFFKETQKVTITAADDISGVDSVYYDLSEKALTQEEVGKITNWTKGTEFQISPDKVCVIYAKLTDKQGNIAYISSDGMVFDGTAPAVTGISDGATYCISAQAKVTDAYLSSVTVNGKRVTPDAQGGITLAAADGAQNIVATDSAGNRTALTVTVQAAHSYGNWKITKDPAYTAAGTAERVCSADDTHRDTVALPALSDTGVWTPKMKTEPTDTAAGTLEYTSVYGKVTVSVPSLSDGSVWKKGSRTEPTEDRPGSQTYISTEYGTVTVEIPALSDTNVWTARMNPAPTEDTPGAMEYTSAKYGTVTAEIPKLMDTDVWTVKRTAEPGKDATGSMEYTSKYGTVTVSIPALSDATVWTEKVTAEPTEDNPGSREYSSDRYGTVTESIPALSDEDAWKKGNRTEPTEDTPGSQVYISSEYGTVTTPIPALSDTNVWTARMNPAPTENAAGIMEYISEKYGTVSIPIPALSDRDVWAARMNPAPTRDTAGAMEYTSKYGTITVDIPALSDADTWIGKTVTDPTEEEPGTLRYTSEKYGEVEVPIPALTDTGVWQPGTRLEPTESEDGSQEYISAEYGKVTEKIPALGHEHRWNGWESDSDRHWRVCDCGEKKDLAAHIFGAWVTDREPLENEPGNRHRVCEECGYVEDQSIVYGGVTTEVVSGENVPDTRFSMEKETLEDILLTQEDREQIDNGKDISFFLTVTDVGGTVSEADKAAVESVSGGWQPGQYLDVSLFKQIDAASYRITETTGMLRITVAIPDNLKNEGREYAVVRVHDGETLLLEDLNDVADTVTIETDRFSTYSIVYKDRKNPSEGGDSEGKPSGDGDSEGKPSGDGDSEGKPSEGGHAGKPSQDGDGGEAADAGTEGKEAGTPQTAAKDNEPKTGDSAPLELAATLAMIGGMGYLMLYFMERRGGMSEEKKKELTSEIIRWAHRGGRLRRMLALAAIFVLLVYYHSIGKKAAVDWDAVYEK